MEIYLSIIGSWLNGNIPALGAIGVAIGFLWSVYQFFLIRERESVTKQFEAFHRLVKELVEPDEKTNVLYVDRQAAIAFELRHFTRYHAFTLRMLKSFLAKAEKDQENLQKHALLLEELRQTITFIEKRHSPWIIDHFGSRQISRSILSNTRRKYILISTKLLLLVGSGLIALPVISEAIRVKQLVDLASVVVNSSRSASFLPAPTIWYAISALTGALLIALSLILDLRARRSHVSASE